MSERAYLTSKELADRWRLSDQTLANWRHAGKGPPYIRVGAREYTTLSIKVVQFLNRLGQKSL